MTENWLLPFHIQFDTFTLKIFSSITVTVNELKNIMLDLISSADIISYLI